MTKMGSKRSKLVSVLSWTFAAVLVSQNLVLAVMSTRFEDEKNYYSPDPHARSPPTGSHGSPSHGHKPPHGSHGGGGGGGCGGCPPTPPSGGGCGTGSSPVNPTPTPSTPGGGYSRPPAPPLVASPPPLISYSPPPISSSPPFVSNSPPPFGLGPPLVPSPPPTTPIIDPGTPSAPSGSVPTPPFLPDPNSNPFPGTCNYWRNHPGVVWGLFGWWATVGSAFGVSGVPGLDTHLNLQQALSNRRKDGFGALYREGTAALLNSMVSTKFPFSTKQVREHFLTALSSDKAAQAQARLFKLANEGRLKPKT